MRGPVRLGVNIDHVATIRQARRGVFPDPVEAARICERFGADQIVCHLREDRRHIQDRDVRQLREELRKPLNLEMSLAPSIVRIAVRLRPSLVTLVPERRQELTTEGGLDVASQRRSIRSAVAQLSDAGIRVSLFIDPSRRQIDACRAIGVRLIELHTGRYANAGTVAGRRHALSALTQAARWAHQAGIRVAAGHGLDYQNVRAIVRIPAIEELNIGYAIIVHSLFVGLPQAVRQMGGLLR